MIRGVRITTVVIMLGSTLATTVQAQDTIDWVLDQPNDIATLDLSVPESPAFTVLGLTPENVVRPSTPRDLAASLLNGVDANGNLQSGVALDTSPFMLFLGDDLSLRDYQTGRLLGLPNWFLASLQTSLATTKGTTDDDEAIRVGLGFRATPWNRGDPRRDQTLAACILKAHNSLHDNLRKLTPEDLEALAAALKVDFPDVMDKLREMTPEQRREKLSSELVQKLEWMEDEQGALVQVDKCLDEARQRNWNASVWEIGAAPSWISPSGESGDLESNGGAFWTSLALGFPYDSNEAMLAEKDEGLRFLRTHSQMILHVRYRVDQDVPDDSVTDGFLEQNDLLAGARLRLGIPRAALSFEAAFVHTDPEGRSSDAAYRLAAIGEIKLIKDVWVNLSVGGQGGRSNGKDEGFVLSTLKYGFNSESSFDIR